MADFLKNAKSFAGDLAKDAVHFPRVAASWPSFKASLIELYKETKSDLFSFRKDTLNPTVNAGAGKLETILKQEASADKGDQLLTLKSETATALSATGEAQNLKLRWSGGLTFAACALAGIAIGSGALLLTLIAGSAAVMKFALNESAAANREQHFADKIDRSILDMAASEGRDKLFSSARFQQALIDKGVLKKVFKGANWGHTKDQAYSDMVAKAAVKAASSAAPALTQGPAA